MSIVYSTVDTCRSKHVRQTYYSSGSIVTTSPSNLNMYSLRMEFEVFKMRYIIAALCLIGAFVHSKTPISEYRLPENFKPTRYNLEITTHLEDKFMFEGVVDINITCLQANDTVVLHANKLDIDTKGVKIVDGNGNSIPVSGVSFVQAKDFMYVKSSNKFNPGDEFVLTIPFMGNITDDLVGYYRSSYVDKGTNQTRWLAVTQFEPADARRAFPCFDEPAMKAHFKIKLGHKKDLTSVSNMVLTKTSPLPSNPDYVLDEYEESVPMSTYLVAYMVSDLVYVDSGSRDGEVQFRIFVRKDAVDQTELAINAGPLVLKYYEDYFDEKFPLSKQDMAAIPDFSYGAMENWGLITYRERALLVDPEVATVDNIHLVAVVIAHELAHQWFGNLVTMKWWTDLWLNEGFATYVSGRGVDFLYPEWNSFQFEIAHNFIHVLDLDSLQSSHPVSVTVGNPDEISQIFDTISYTKGSFLLHMMNSFLGEETFKQGIRNYIHKHKYSNAEQDDLWNALTEEAHRVGSLSKNITLKEIMDTWTLQTGYPVIKTVRDYSANTVTLSQERFLTIKSNNTNATGGCWWVPLTMTSSTEADFNKTRVEAWLNCKNNHYTMALSGDEEWAIFNTQLTGLYRVLYDTRNWMGIIKTLNDPEQYNKIHTLNRVQLIDDALTFAQIGDIDYGIAFQVLKYLKHEKEYIPWLAALHNLGPISELMERTPNYGMYQAYMRRLLLPVYSQFHNMTVELKEYQDIRFKNLVVWAACHNRMKNCTEQALQLFHKWMKTEDPDNNNILPRELKTTIYCQAIKFGGVEEWDFLWKRYEQSNIEAEKTKFLWALGCTSETWLLHRYLNWTIGENAIIRKHEAISVFHAIAGNDIGFYVAKDFLYRNIKEISEYFYPLVHHIGSCVETIGSQMKTKEELHELQSFLNKSSTYLKGTELIVSQTIETVKINIEWTSKFYHKIVNHLI